MDDSLTDLARDLAALPGVIAVALGGSATGGQADDQSDLDLYVYADAAPPVAARQSLVLDRASPGTAEIGNALWEPGDEWQDGALSRWVDVMYRSPAWIEDRLDRVLVRHEASLGYSTCLWHNVLTTRPLIDDRGWYRNLQARARVPYPSALKRSIIALNHPVLRTIHSSYRHQVALAVVRTDLVSIQHRLTALLASLFDILFAANERPHPGEKRLLDHVAALPLQPAGLADRLRALLDSAPSGSDDDRLLTRLDVLLDALDQFMTEIGLMPGKSARYFA